MAKKSIDEIVRQQLPGYRVASSQASDAADAPAKARADAASRSLEALKRKYLGQNAGLDEAVRTAAGADDDVEIVPIVPVDTPSGAEPPRRAKAAVISKRAGKVIGEQG